MKFLVHLFGIILFSLCITVRADSREPEENKSFIHVISGGVSIPSSEYRDYLESGINLNYNAIYKIPFLFRNTYFNGGLSYSTFRIRGAEDVYLRQGDINAGALISYPWNPMVEPYAGISGHLIYSNFNARHTGGTEHALKPGISFNAGNMMYLGSGVGFLFNAGIRISELSGKRMSPITINGGISYCLAKAQDERQEYSPKILLYEKGVDRFRKKDINAAENFFLKLKEIDSEYEGLAYHLKRITEIKQSRQFAEQSMKSRDYLKAIPYLEECSPYIDRCRENLVSARKQLAPIIPVWEKKGIDYYEKKNYGDCISIMEKILLADPLNRNARIYLPRARKRQKALDTFQGR